MQAWAAPPFVETITYCRCLVCGGTEFDTLPPGPHPAHAHPDDRGIATRPGCYHLACWLAKFHPVSS